MAATNPVRLITRRGFLECGSAALASVGLIGNACAAESVLSSQSVQDTAKTSSEPPLGKIALEKHFVLTETIDTSYAVSEEADRTEANWMPCGRQRAVWWIPV
jgi:hypothetical protein